MAESASRARANGKGRSGRVIPLNRDLRQALQELLRARGASPYVIISERSQRTSAAVIVNLFAGWYRALGFQGCSSHSGRRTFITGAARKISIGRPPQGRSDAGGTCGSEHDPALYEADVEAQRKVVDLI